MVSNQVDSHGIHDELRQNAEKTNKQFFHKRRALSTSGVTMSYNSRNTNTVLLEIYNSMNVTGKVVYVDLSGGFWGIEGDDGQQYCPVQGLPSRFQKENLRVKAKVQPSSAMGIFMWGKNVDVKRIDTL